MRVAYCDPPYPGQAKKHYGDHPDFRGEVDHRALIGRLEDEFPDGWALSTGAKNLRDLLLLAPPETRVLIWDKKAGAPVGDHFYWRWEPVLLRGCRRPKGYPHTLLEEPSVTGAKPEKFCRWLFECMGLQADDELIDLFPGSGAVAAAWDAWRAQPEPVGALSQPSSDNKSGEG
jgi:hypothetical protein